MNIEEVTTKTGEEYISDNYPKDGVFISTTIDSLVIVNKKIHIVFGLGTSNDWKHIFEEETNLKPNGLTESFALKMLATALGDEETKRQILNK